MTRVILIHGINNEGKSEQIIRETWSDAIGRGFQKLGLPLPLGIEYHAAYYGDMLYEGTLSWGADDETAKPMGIDSPENDYADYQIAALYREFQAAHNISDEAVRSELNEKDDRAATSMAGGIHKRWLKAIARALERILPSKGRNVARLFLRQASAYLERPGLKERIDDLVLDQVFDDLGDESCIVIAHSLGTIVAYALLRRLRHRVRVKLLLTAGSPLGSKLVQQRLGPPLVCLPNVHRWINLTDPDDFVAIQNELNQSTFGCNVIENVSNLDNGSEDAHSIERYLEQSAAVETLKNAIGSSN